MHVSDIIDSGVASLKIEGRMKSPEYVRGVTRVWRRLLDEGRDASQNEMRELAELFSRGGFTDSYYQKTVGRSMLGTRSESDKQASREIEKFNKITRKVPVDIRVELSADRESKLTMNLGQSGVTVCGDKPETAINAPLDRETVVRCMSKLGDTPFVASSVQTDIEGSVMMPISALNALRRRGAEALLAEITKTKDVAIGEVSRADCKKLPHKANIARFYRREQITDAARSFFDGVLLPLERYLEDTSAADGFYMPPVAFDGEWREMTDLIEKAARTSPKYAIVTNIGQLEALRKVLPDTKIIADFRFNVANCETVAYFEEQGVDSVVLSAELTLPQMRDIVGSKAAVVYGLLQHSGFHLYQSH